MATTTVSLSPSPAFCVKSTALNSLSLSPGDAASINIPTGTKVFVNVAWDTNVPPPPDGSDAAIERAMGLLDCDHAAALSFVPIIVSDPRLDTDKAGKPSVVIDCVYNTSLKSRALRSPEFKTYLIELAFQRIEAQHALLLSRQIGTPNILSKGKLQKRTVLIPTALYSPAHPGGEPTAAVPEPTPSNPRKPLIEELPAAPPKGILKKKALPPTATESPSQSLTESSKGALLVPELTWSRTSDGRLRIALSVPHLTRAAIPSATLDIEPRRLIFTSPGYALDLDLDLDSSKLDSAHTRGLERERELDVDGARAEWRVAERTLVIYA